MCGIGGFMTRDGSTPPTRLLVDMLRALGHRGPDGEGRYLAGGLGMVQTRLAIIDLETGDQPFFEPEGAALVANGEIYNYLELRQMLGDAPLQTKSDCEPALYLYRRFGVSYVDRLRGMFAIALYDPREDVLLLSRDPFGIKPLYYAEIEHGLLFASEPGALLATGLIKPAVRTEAAGELLQLQFTTGRETIFEGILRVLPGETLEVVRGRVVDRHRRKALPQTAVREQDEAGALAELDRVLLESVAMHQRSDVPYGLFLSGGIDSSVLLACMAKLNDEPVMAFTAGFSGTGVQDERQHARMLARHVGATHVEVDVSADDFWNLLPEIACFVDDPAADYAIVPTYKLAAEAAKELKVVLCGEGGDELFAGYGRYRSVLRPLWLGGRTMRPRGFLDGMNILRDESPNWRDGIVAAESRVSAPGQTRLQTAQAADCEDWLPNDLLIKLDRCLMAHGLEGRTPLLDPEVARFAYGLPDRLKVDRRKGKGKYLLRRWLQLNLPEADPFSPKRGFTVPVGEWISAKADRLAPLVAAQPGIIKMCKPEGVLSLFRSLSERRRQGREGHAAWVLLFYALWHQAHIIHARPGGDVFDSLIRPS
ncbi:MAG: asparagine synthase (glutamine-hydrolyzing) [Alphaproteobacteria bacterium]